MTTTTPPPLGQELDGIRADMTAATDAWAAAGYPLDGPVCDAREAVFARLRAWNDRAAARGY